jgi:hypothetical protein
VDHTGARYFGYRLGEMSLLLEKKLVVDISQWKEKNLGHVASPGIQKTYGSQRDVFDNRMVSRYKRLCRETAEQAAHLCKREHFSAIFLVGPQRMADPIATQIPADLRRHVIVIKKDLGKAEPHAIQIRLTPEIEKWEHKHELSLVEDLLVSGQGAVLGVDETLTQLQKGAIRTLVLSRDFNVRLHQCRICAWTDYSADPVCPLCQGQRSDVFLRDVLPDLAAASDVEIEVVSGDAAKRLSKAGNIGAWLRLKSRIELAKLGSIRTALKPSNNMLVRKG